MTSNKPDPIDTSVPHSARIWNYWMGGKDNYEIDRQAGDDYADQFPGIIDMARHSRAFLCRVVRFLTGEAGIRQFLDIGTGLPSHDNTHEVAQRLAPNARVVYVDNDPLVLAHARALLTGVAEGSPAYIDADVHQPEAILEQAAATLDLQQPVALLLMGIMGHVTDDDQARSIVTRLLHPLPAGSYLALYDGINTDSALNQAQQGYDDTGAIPYRLRSPDQIAAFFEGLEVVEPGVVRASQWRPDPTPFGPDPEVTIVGGVAKTT